MTKQDLVRDMKKEIGSLPTISQIAKYMGKSRDQVREHITAGLDYYQDGRSKHYFVGDVADVILRHRIV